MHTKVYSENNYENTRNMCTQQPLTHASNISLENPNNNDNFSKFSKKNKSS